MHRLPCPALFVLALVGLSAHAHHSVAATFDSGRQITVSGVIAEFRFVQPHPFVVLDTNAGATEPQRWHLEMDTYRELVEIGVTEDTLRPGDTVIVVGDRARDGTERLYIRQLDRPVDGFRYEVPGFHPSISTAP